MDETGLRILKELKEDSKRSSREIAEKLGLSEGTVYNRVKKMQEDGTIKRRTIDIDPEKIGRSITAAISMVTDPRAQKAQAEWLSKRDEVTAAYKITGEYDMLILACFPDRASLKEFVDIACIKLRTEKTNVNIVLSRIRD
jgi:Lrp/AsnC family transcriptional regulator, regulator for asnA, asnC and gidA